MAMFLAVFLVLARLINQYPLDDPYVLEERYTTLPLPSSISWKINLTATSKTSNPFRNITLPLCLVHVGKAGGSSVSCGLGIIYADCEGMPRNPIPKTNFFHMRRNKCPANTATFLVTLRNPITRIRSWFDFEKNIIPPRQNKQEAENIKRKRGMLFTECYSDFATLATEGLEPLDNMTIDATKVKDMTCPQRAWAAVIGARAFSYHEWYNYEHYWNGVHALNLSSPPIFKALRTEHLQRDWSSVSREDLYRRVNRGQTGGEHGNKTLLTKQALSNLCRALCPEIQIYKQFLTRADNLNSLEVLKSIEEVQRDCPGESSELRRCPGIPSFPFLRVKKGQFKQETKKRLFQVI
jgi:hypothetical protein